MQLRTCIIDDEALARERLRFLLQRCPSIELIGEFGSADASLPFVRAKRPDLIFLDIEMPGLNGLELASVLRREFRSAIVFVTAHESFAVPAFGVEAVDYLLKPFDTARLLESVARAQEWVGHRRTGAPDAVAEREATAATLSDDRLVVRVDGRIVVVPYVEIEWIEAANNYAVFHLTTGKRLMVRTTLNSLADRLPRTQFARVNRSAFANRHFVVEIRPMNYGDSAVVLRDGTSLWISRGRRADLLAFVGARDAAPKR